MLYPLGVWAVSRIPGLHANAEGSIVTVDGRAVGSDLIGIDPVAKDPNNDPWFHNRPSAVAQDLDGDGSYEIVVHQAGRGRDNSQAGATVDPNAPMPKWGWGEVKGPYQG